MLQTKIILRIFGIIGEAANQISEEIEEQYTTIPWSLMRPMWNHLVHAYLDERFTFGNLRAS